MGKYLVGITIGPVQAYIQESRKLKDLYNSSKIISNIMQSIMLEISKVCSVELVYPYIEIKDFKCDKTNKVNNEIDFSNYCVFIIDNFANIHEIKNCVYKNIKEQFVGGNKFSLEESFHMFWCMKELDNDDDYEKNYRELTHEISSLKNTYDFEQVVQEGKRKCLICGKRNIINDELKSIGHIKMDMQNQEDICIQCLFKRLYNEKINKGKSDNCIKSVYSIAVEEWKKKYRDQIKYLKMNLEEICGEGREDKYYNSQEIDRVISILQQCINNIPKELQRKIKEIDNDLKNISIISQGHVEQQYIYKLECIKKQMEEIYEKNNESKVPVPNYEYCFVQMDVDSLGKIISKSSPNLKERQQNISKALISYAKELKVKLKDKCTFIYAGGDDILIVCCLENLSTIVKIIDGEFIKVKNKYSKIDDYNQITYSMSITIAQCKDPMSYALFKTREKLESVKERYNYKYFADIKSGVAITYIVNTGKEICCYIKKDRFMSYINREDSVKEVEKDKNFSYINKFYDEFNKLQFKDITYDESQNLHCMFVLGLRRLMKRSFKINAKDEEFNKKNTQYIEWLVDFISDVISENHFELKSNHVNIDFSNIMNVLKIYRKLCLIEEEN